MNTATKKETLAKNNNTDTVIRQYIRRYDKNDNPENVGCLVATKDKNGEISIGWSLLNPSDRASVKRYNQKVKEVNAIGWRARNQKEENAEVKYPIEMSKPLFDKERAVEIALNRATPMLSLYSLKRDSRDKIRDSEIFKFVQMVARHFKGGVVKISA